MKCHWGKKRERERTDLFTLILKAEELGKITS